MNKRQLLASACALLVATAWAQQPPSQRFDPRRDAQADVQQALALAQAEGKKVLIDVGGEWCSWCHILDRFIAAHPEVQRTLQAEYVRVKVNFSPQNRNEKVLGRWPKPTGYPHLYVLDAAGQLLASQPSVELEAGQDYDEAKVLAFLKRHAARS
jgi:thioredoxin-related protein